MLDDQLFLADECPTRENFSARHGLTKCTIKRKLLNQICRSWYHFSQKMLPHPLILFIAKITHGKEVIGRFFWAIIIPILTKTCRFNKTYGKKYRHINQIYSFVHFSLTLSTSYHLGNNLYLHNVELS